MKNPKVSMIIPNWNGEELLIDCLNSLEKQTFKDFEIIVVDNGSKDHSIDYINENFPAIKIIKNNKNLGFAKAINLGVKNCSSQYVVFLNNDTAADKDWLKKLVDLADEHPQAVSVNSRMLNFYHRDMIDGVGIEINEVGQAKSIGWNEKDSGQYGNPFYIFGATGGASLFNREKFVNLGMFDEDYFMYSEEVDFAYRANFAGFKSIYCPSAVVYHKHKASASKKPQFVEYWQFKNMFQTIIKNYPTLMLLKNHRWLKIMLVYLNTVFYQLKNGYYWPPLITTIWLIVNLPKLLYKRFKVQSKIQIDAALLEVFFVPKKITFWQLLK